MITEPDWKGKCANPHGQVIVGEGTEIREFVSINKPTKDVTYIGSNCYIMNRVFVGHDCHIGDGVQLNPGCSIAGFVKIGDYSHVGMNASIHQNSELGKYCVLGAGSFFKGRSPDGVIWGGVPAVPLKANYIGMARSPLSDEDMASVVKAAEEYVDRFKSSRNI